MNEENQNAYSSGFDGALSALYAEKKVARSGWNGKGMYLYLVRDNNYPSTTQIAKDEFGESVPYQSYIAFKTADNTVVPWTASHTDLLSNDWFVVV